MAPESVKVFTKANLKIDLSSFPRCSMDSIVRKATVDDPVMGHLTVAVKTPCGGNARLLDALKRVSLLFSTIETQALKSCHRDSQEKFMHFKTYLILTSYRFTGYMKIRTRKVTKNSV